MTTQLPYQFNTTQSGRIICVALAVSGIFIIPCLTAVAYGMSGFNGIPFVIGPLLLVALGDVVAAFILFKKLGGATGRIDAHNVVVKADNILGMRSGAPDGSYGLSQFASIKLQPRGDNLARLILVGKTGTPDVTFFNGPFATAKILAEELGGKLNLPVEPTVKTA